MKYIKLGMILAFGLVIFLPVALFRWQSEIVSEIDNRILAENPFSKEVRNKGGSLKSDIEQFVNDRIGLRDQMILSYTLLNDCLFDTMVHPNYCYGRDGYVFFKMNENQRYSDFYDAFADMVKEIQDYCEARCVPFLFVFEPSKISILQEYLPVGVRYDNSWVEQFFDALDDRDVHYVDNTKILRQQNEAGVAVFNQKYDAGHWNDIGAFYGVNAILDALRKYFPDIHINTWDEMEFSEKLETSLSMSQFPIQEWTPFVPEPSMAKDQTGIYDEEVERNPSYRSFGYYVNQNCLAEGSPKTLVFQGSYMNGSGRKFFMNALGEYIWIHNYQNVIDFDYYFNIFSPECVVFEVTEYALNNGYFDYDRLQSFELNPNLTSVQAGIQETEERTFSPETLNIEQGKALTKITWSGNDGNEEYVWAVLGNEFDMRQNDNGDYEVTVMNDIWNQNQNKLEIMTQAGNIFRSYHH